MSEIKISEHIQDDPELDISFLYIYTCAFTSGTIKPMFILNIELLSEYLSHFKRILHRRLIFEYDTQFTSDKYEAIELSLFHFTCEERQLIIDAVETRQFSTKWKHLPVSQTQALIYFLIAGAAELNVHPDGIHISFIVDEPYEILKQQLLRLFVYAKEYVTDGYTIIIPIVRELSFLYPEYTQFIIPSYYQIDRLNRTITVN